VGSVFGATAVADFANALPADTAPENSGGLVLSPASGTFSTPFAMQFSPSNQACPGNNNDGWAYSTFLTADDPAQLDYSAAGQPSSPDLGRTTAFRDSGGTFVRGLFPDLTTYNMIPQSGLSFAQTFSSTPLAVGEYTVGIACWNVNSVDYPGVGDTLDARETAVFWSQRVTVTESGGVFSYTSGWAPAAPVLSIAAYTGTSQAIGFTQPARDGDPAIPAVTSYSLAVSPSPSDALPTVSAGDTSFTLTGLTKGTLYTVEMSAVNSVGEGPVQNITGFTFTAAEECVAPVVTALDVFDGDAVEVNWSAPAGCGDTPADYDVAILDGSTTVASQLAVSGTTASFAGVALGDYTAQVTANFAGGTTTAPAGTASVSVKPNSVMYGSIDVTRPLGALVLTQRCGVFGELPAYSATAAFPKSLALAAASVDQVGTAPVLDNGSPDPVFDGYPNPVDSDGYSTANYPTTCTVDLSNTELVLEDDGAGIGQYVAYGRLNQVTVVDTRDDDAGWEATIEVGRFVTSGGDSFSGDYLGWVPEAVGSGEVPLVDEGATTVYQMNLTAGAAIDPGTPNGLSDGELLGSAPAGAGLGVAVFDARLLLTIPPRYDAGDYSASISISVISL